MSNQEDWKNIFTSMCTILNDKGGLIKNASDLKSFTDILENFNRKDDFLRKYTVLRLI